MRPIVLCCLWVPWVCLAPATARAESPYQVQPALDSTLTLLFFGVAAGIELSAPDRAPLSCHPCKPNDVNALDRPVIGPLDAQVSGWSDVLLGLTIASPFLVSTVHELGADGRSAEAVWVDALVLAETMGATLLLTQAVKYSVRRPRPYTYAESDQGSAQAPRDASLSFFSGHSALAFAAAVSGTQTLVRRGVRGPGLFLTGGLSLGLATAVAIGRVKAAKHFWSDVAVGAGVGAFMGWLVPWLHAKSDAHEETAHPISITSARSVVFTGRF